MNWNLLLLKMSIREGHVHKYKAVFGSFVDSGIVVTFLSFTGILSFRL